MVTLHTSPLDPPGIHDAGGMNVLVRELATALVTEGANVTLVTRRADKQQRNTAAALGIDVRELDALNTELSKAELAHHIDDVVAELAEALRDVDVVHSHYWLSAVATERARELLRAAGEPVPEHVTTLHTREASKVAAIRAQSGRADSPDGGVLPDVDQLRLDAESRIVTSVPVIVSSETEAREVKAIDPAVRVSVITPGVDTTQFQPLPDAGASVSPSPTPAEIFAVVGRIQPFKGQEFALEVFAEYVSRNHARKTTQLVFVGEPTPDAHDYVEEIRARVSMLVNHGQLHEGQVTFTGAGTRDEVASLLASATVTIIPSIAETFGLVALESAAAGTPVIAQAVGGLTASVSSESGILLIGRNPAQWADALEALTADPKRLDQLRNSSRAFALEHDWQAVASQHLALYRRLR